MVLKAVVALKSVMFIVIGIGGIGLLIAWHEFGHFLFCKLFRVKVPTFSIGFGPRLLTKKWGETEFSLSAIPLGGYVEIAQTQFEQSKAEQTKSGHVDESLTAEQVTPEHIRDRQTPATGIRPEELHRYFDQKPYWQRLFIMFGGIMFNMLFAYIALTALFATGMPDTPLARPDNLLPSIASIMPESPASKAGLQVHDVVLAINNQKLEGHVERLFEFVAQRAGQHVTLSIERNGSELTVPLTVGERGVGTNIGFLGIVFATAPLKPFPLIKALQRGISRTHQVALSILYSFKYMITQRTMEGLGGPVAIFAQTTAFAQQGFKIFLIFLAFMSINLAVLNLIPLPILDGGQILITTIEAVIRQPLSARLREYIALVTWALVLGLMLVLAWRDIKGLRSTPSNSPKAETRS